MRLKERKEKLRQEKNLMVEVRFLVDYKTDHGDTLW